MTSAGPRKASAVECLRQSEGCGGGTAVGDSPATLALVDVID